MPGSVVTPLAVIANGEGADIDASMTAGQRSSWTRIFVGAGGEAMNLAQADRYHLQRLRTFGGSYCLATSYWPPQWYGPPSRL